MTIPTPRIYTNSQSIPFDTLLNRLRVNDVSVRIDYLQSSNEDGLIINQVIILSDTLTEGQISSALATIQSQAEIDALARKAVARTGGLSTSQLGNATPAGIATYVTTQVSNNVNQVAAIAAINNLTAVNIATNIKPILIAIVNGQYAIMNLLILVGNILAYIRDEIWPN